MIKSIAIISALLSVTGSGPNPADLPLENTELQAQIIKPYVPLASKSFSLSDRYNDARINSVFRDNILLTLSYMSGVVKSKSDINWVEVNKPQSYHFTLLPGQSFTFHDQRFANVSNVVKTTNAHFNAYDGFKSDGYLVGDGVCHFASLLYWVSKEAGLAASAPTNHNFAKINKIPREFGVSIYYLPGELGVSSRQNLYITNNFTLPVTFLFDYDGTNLGIQVIKSYSIASL